MKVLSLDHLISYLASVLFRLHVMQMVKIKGNILNPCALQKNTCQSK